jgi:hypothetical protein
MHSDFFSLHFSFERLKGGFRALNRHGASLKKIINAGLADIGASARSI